MNSVVLVGRLARDPELRVIPQTETSVTNFTVAVDRPYSKDKEKTADFIRCVCYGKQAEFCERYFTKGKMIGIQGRIQERSYQDKNGETKYITEVIANNIEFVGGKGDSPAGSSDYGSAPRTAPAPETTSALPEGFQALEDDDDIPF